MNFQWSTSNWRSLRSCPLPRAAARASNHPRPPHRPCVPLTHKQLASQWSLAPLTALCHERTTFSFSSTQWLFRVTVWMCYYSVLQWIPKIHKLMVKKVNHSIDETLKLFRFSSVLAAWHYMGLQTDTLTCSWVFSHISVVMNIPYFRAGLMSSF